jgi:Protein of unknown function (DUF4239)
VGRCCVLTRFQADGDLRDNSNNCTKRSSEVLKERLMSLYWVYDLPTGLFGAVTVIVFVGFGLGGLFLLRGWIRRIDTGHHAYNHIVGFYLAGVTVLYAVCAGLLAIGAWETFSEVQGKIDHEAAALGALYRDVGAYPEPIRTVLQNDLRKYAREVIDVGWPMQRRGIVPNNASPVLNDFQRHFMSFEPQDQRQNILAAEAYRSFNDLTASRRDRLNSIQSEMPGPLWALVILGAAICIVMTWFLHAESFIMHIWMTVLFSGLLALLIFLIAVLDNPYRGNIGVSAEPLERVYEQIMSPQN